LVEQGKHSLRVSVDGEVRSLDLPLHYKIRPLTLKVIVPFVAPIQA